MKFVMVSKYGEGSGVAYRIMCEGNDVELFITEKENRKIYDGLIPKVDKLPYDGDVYIFDVTGNGNIADILRKQGKRVVAGSSFCDNIEENRDTGIELMQAIDVKIPQTEFFTSYEHAKQFIEENEGIWVFKPCGRGLPTKLTYKPYDEKDLIRYLTYIEKEFKTEKLEFLLQEFVEGVAVSTEGWFDGTHFIRPFDKTIENKKYGVDNLGPSTGCEGDIVWGCDDSDPIVKALLGLKPILADEGYIGPIDINCIVNQTGFYGLEWTPRFGYDATPTLLKLFNDDVGKFFAEMEELPIDEGFAGSIRVSIPPYPLEVLEDEKMPHNGGIPIDGIEGDEDNYYFYEVMENGEGLVHAGGVGLICAVLSTSEQYESVLKDAYKLAENLRIPDKYYRTDLQEVLNKDYEEYTQSIKETK